MCLRLLQLVCQVKHLSRHVVCILTPNNTWLATMYNVPELSLSGACHEDVAASTSVCYAGLSQARCLADARPKLSGRRSSSTVLVHYQIETWVLALVVSTDMLRRLTNCRVSIIIISTHNIPEWDGMATAVIVNNVQNVMIIRETFVLIDKGRYLISNLGITCHCQQST